MVKDSKSDSVPDKALLEAALVKELPGVENGDPIALARSAVIEHALQSSLDTESRIRWKLFKVLESENVDLLLEVSGSLSLGWGLFADGKLGKRFQDRALEVSYKGSYFRGLVLSRGDPKNAKPYLEVAANQGHIASKIQLLINRVPKSPLFRLLVKIYLNIYLHYLLASALNSDEGPERLWRIRDIVPGYKLAHGQVDRQIYLADLQELTKAVPTREPKLKLKPRTVVGQSRKE